MLSTEDTINVSLARHLVYCSSTFARVYIYIHIHSFFAQEEIRCRLLRVFFSRSNILCICDNEKERKYAQYVRQVMFDRFES